MLEHLQHLHHVQVAVTVVVLSIIIIMVEYSSPDQTSPHLADAEEVAPSEPDGDDGHDEEVEHAEDGDDEDIPGHAAVDCRHEHYLEEGDNVDILQHGLELRALPDQQHREEEDGEQDGEEHEEDAEGVVAAADLLGLHTAGDSVVW